MGKRVSVTVLLVVLATSACDRKLSPLASGHPLESTTVESWQLEGDSITVQLSFRDDAPSYGCTLEAFDEEDESIGYVRARPRGEEERTMTIKLDDGEQAEDVDDVRVTDCDM